MLVQAVLFNNKQWLLKEARDWLKSHNYKSIKPVHTTLNYHRFRIRSPEEFKSFYTKKLPNGITLIFGV
jgi:hypothetical protein